MATIWHSIAHSLFIENIYANETKSCRKAQYVQWIIARFVFLCIIIFCEETLIIHNVGRQISNA